MQGCDDLQPFLGLIASTVARSQDRNTNLWIFKAALIKLALRRTIGSHLPTQNAVPRTIPDPKNQNAQQCHVSGCSRDFGFFGMRRDSCQTRKSKKIGLTRFWENWELSSGDDAYNFVSHCGCSNL